MHTRSRLLLAVCLMTLSACSSHTDTPMENEGENNPMPTVTISPNTQAKNLEHGEITGISIGALSGVNGTLANGVATAYSFEDGASIVSIQLNVAIAEEGTLYDAWLEDATGQRLEVGALQSSDNDVRHSARLDTKTETQNYKNVRILLRKSTDTPGQGTVIATGILKDSGH